jgi:electron transport complex protein RnfC
MTVLADPSPFRVMPVPDGLRVAPLSINRVSCPTLDWQIEAARAGKAIDTLLCCILDTDPGVPLMNTAAAEFGDLVATGLQHLADVCRLPKIVVAADPFRPTEWVAPLRGRISSVKVVPIRGDYPQTDPTLMLYSVTDRRLIPGRLPTDAGVLLVDAAAAVVVGRRALDPFSVIRTPLAVLDHFTGVTHLLDAPIGISLNEIMTFIDVQTTNTVVRGGDFLRDQWSQYTDPVGGGEIVFHITAAAAAANPDPCIRCGWCVEACPTNISPVGLLDAAQKNDQAAARFHGLHACIECGVCSYVCPTRLPLLASIRGMRAGGR